MRTGWTGRIEEMERKCDRKEVDKN